MNGACIEKSETAITPGEQPGIQSQVRRIYWLLLLIVILIIVIGYIMYNRKQKERIMKKSVIRESMKKPAGKLKSVRGKGR